jgi:hypothetical protein
MPYNSYADFLERAPLYVKLREHVPTTPQEMKVSVVQHYCERCKAMRPFRLPGTSKLVRQPEAPLVMPGMHIPPTQGLKVGRSVTELVYHCTSCEAVSYTVWVEIEVFGRPEHRKGGREVVVINESKWVWKVGQTPPWAPPPIGKHLEALLGEDEQSFFEKGLACESQSYGVGAYAYYRRIVEGTIDTLLPSILDLIPERERPAYEQALTNVARATAAKDKIALVKDLLPTTLRPNGYNPLGVLHTALSEGIHQDSDEKCLEYAGEIREVLSYLITQLATQKESSARFTKSMQKLLDKNKPKSASAAPTE